MEERKYLNEELYQENNKKVKKIGKILLFVGLGLLIVSIILIIVGAVGFGNNALNENESGILGSMGFFAIGSFMSVFSFGLASVGGMMLFISYRREITAYSTQQVMPVAKEGIEEMTPVAAKSAEKMAPAAGKVAEEVARGIKKGLKEDK